tara:strand:+ start:136 stop:618 length:483 start_codon:yes stop_codon:yes gene_type:complete
MSADERQEDLELLAELVGTTNAELKNVDEMIVSKSANLKTSNDQWNPNEILKTHMQTAGTAPAPAPPPPSPTAVVPPAGVHPQVQQQVFAQQPQMQQPQIMHVVTREFEDRLESVEKKLDIILSTLAEQEQLDKKITNFVDRGLKDRVKQITLKLDDTKD